MTGSSRQAVIHVEGDGEPRIDLDGTGPSDRFEMGSVTKGLTGLLLADLVESEVVELDQPLREVDDRYAGSAVGESTLRSLATHASGLPRLPRGPAMTGRVFASAFLGVDPYGGLDDERVARDARRQRLRPGRAGYSNLGAAVLGNALARHLGSSYPELLDDRVLGPMGMDETGLQAAPAGHRRNGRSVRPWRQTGYAPAGGVTSTPRDLARLLTGLVRRTAPGLSALDPIAPAPEGTGRIGLFWMVSTGPAGTRIWHNGQTGGYAAYLALDRERSRGVVVVADVADADRVSRLARPADGGAGPPG